jgi:hypothetical protein
VVTNLSVYPAAYVFVPSVLGENIPTAKFRMISAKFAAGTLKENSQILMRTFTCRSTFLYEKYLWWRKGPLIRRRRRRWTPLLGYLASAMATMTMAMEGLAAAPSWMLFRRSDTTAELFA